MTETLIERLRVSSCWWHHPAIADEAADEIERLEAEIDRLKANEAARTVGDPVPWWNRHGVGAPV